MHVFTMMITTVFGAGFLPFAPGTWGSLVGVGTGILLMRLQSLTGAIVLCFFLGWWASARVLMGTAHVGRDPSFIVIDELVGQWIAMFPIVFFYENINYISISYILLSFILFRLFDIWKPWPVSWADAYVGGGPFFDGLGIMLDDVLAGLMAAFIVTLMWKMAIL